MNYYEHHLGDYARDTAHLSLLEDGCYRRLIDIYYIRERPLPADLKECCKLARAQSKPERNAVAYVLKEFFDLTEDGYRQKRCDEVIADFLDKRAKAKRSADARWEAQRTQCERNANASKPHMRDECEVDAPNPQSPVTSNQEEKRKTPLTPQGGAIPVFEHWKKIWSHPDAKLDPKRRARIEARLKTFSVENLCDAISGFRNSDWHTGRDPKGDGKVYDKIETLLRDDSQVEEGMRLFAHPPRPPPKPEQLSPVERVLRANGVSRDGRVVAEQFGSGDAGVGDVDGHVREPPYAGFRRIGS